MIAPRSETELLEFLDGSRWREVRAVGSLHSWSDVTVTYGLCVDVGHLHRVRIERGDEGDCHVHVGAGCRVRGLQSRLAKAGLSLPSLGLIGAQTVAGAVATGTHGSGRHSLSHYVQRVRAVVVDPDTGRPRIEEWTGGDGLRAARCALGRMGIHTELTFECVPLFDVEERTRRFTNINDVLAQAIDWPLQQFYLIPWSWDWYAHQRRESGKPSPWYAPLYRLYRFLWVDLGFHLLVVAIGRLLRRPAWIRGFYRTLFPRLMFTRPRTVDRVDRVLFMRHELFRHVETELFVPESLVREAAAFVRAMLEYAGGQRDELPEELLRQIQSEGLREELAKLHGVYTHHFPVTFRRVLPDDTLISMSAGREPRYAISLITYDINHLAGFEAVTAFLCRAMARLFNARPHWGKWYSPSMEGITALYQGYGRFRQLAEKASRSR